MYKRAINFSLSNANTIIFNLTFSSHFSDNQVQESLKISKAHKKKTKIRVEKTVKAQVKKKTRKTETITKKVIQTEAREIKR